MQDPLTIQAALVGLHKYFPTDTVSVWWDILPNGSERFTFRIVERKDIGLENVWGHGDTMGEALVNVMQNSGERDPMKIRREKIAELRDRLAKLEALQSKGETT